MQIYDAALLKHFGGVPFGATSEEVARVFGTPDQIENLDSGDGTSAPVWHYWSKGFSLFFDTEDGNKLCCVEADNSVLLDLMGKKIFSLNEHEVKDLMKSSGFKDLDEENHEWGEKRVTFDDANVDYYFEKGIMVSINFGVMF